MRCLVLVLLAWSGWTVAADDAAEPAGTELEIAGSSEIYLVLDVDRHRLDVQAQGVTLRSWPLGEARWAMPRLSRDQPSRPIGIYRVTRELPLPERVRLVPPAPGAPPPAADPRPKRAEWIAQIPTDYRVSLEPHLDVRVVGQPPDEVSLPNPSLGDRWANLRAGFSDAPAAPRLLVVLSPADARALYLLLRPGTGFIVR